MVKQTFILLGLKKSTLTLILNI